MPVNGGAFQPMQPYYQLGASVTYQCFSGRVLDGSTMNFCIGLNTWNMTAPTCSEDGETSFHYCSYISFIFIFLIFFIFLSKLE